MVEGGSTNRLMENDMMRGLSTLLVGANLVLSASAVCAQELDWQKVDDVLGRKAAVVAGQQIEVLDLLDT